DRAIYVLGADHHGYVARLKAAAAMLGYDSDRVEVLLYQLVHLTRGGEQTKMSKRRGDVVFLDDFVDEVGVDAARWYLVNRGPDAIPAYAIRVADDFHRFYHEHRVLESEQESFRLTLCRATQQVIARCLWLVGVDAPERM